MLTPKVYAYYISDSMNGVDIIQYSSHSIENSDYYIIIYCDDAYEQKLRKWKLWLDPIVSNLGP